MTFTERILRFFRLAPVRELDEHREQLRTVRASVSTAVVRAYEAGKVSRLTQDWLTTYQTIDSDIRSNLANVRQRARDLVKNDGLARRYLNLCKVNIVGPKGFKLQMNAKEPRNGKMVPDVVANMKIEEAWNEFVKAENCSVNGRHSFRAICDQLVGYRKVDGEAFLRIISRKSAPHGILLEIVPTELIDEQYNERLTDNSAVKMGVELDAWRRPVAYHIRKIDQASEVMSIIPSRERSVRVPASEMIHYFDQTWADQTRGMSDIAPSMVRLRHLSGYEEAAVINARISAAKGGFFSNKSSEPGASNEFSGDRTDSDGNIQIDVEPGKMSDIGDKQFTPWDPTFPHAQHEMFVKTEGKMIAAGLNVAYASLSNDLSEANYSSNRVGLLDEREMWKHEQEEFIEQVLTRVFSAWLESALLKGVITLPFAKFDQFNKPTWSGRRWAWIDPQKDLEAIRTELDLKITSLYDVIGERGEDLEQIFSDIAEVKLLAEKYGITLTAASPKPKEPDDAIPDAQATDDPARELLLEAITRPGNGNGKH